MVRLPLAAVAAVYAVVCLALWPSSLFGLLHVESAAVVAGAGFFASGLATFALLRAGRSFGWVLARLVALLAVPWALLTATLLWRANCGYALGLLLFVVFAVPSVALGAALAYALDRLDLRLRRTAFLLIGLAVAALPPIFDVGLHPQFYTYNHVWGGVLGPIYDEELALRPGLFFFRGLTLWWAVALVLVGRRARLRRMDEPGAERESRRHGLALLGVGCLIAACYLAAPWLGLTTPGWYTQERLGGHLAVERFDLYYDPQALSEEELQVIADEHRFRYHQLREALGVDVTGRIATYLYPDADTKGALTGARETSVAPVWLPRPQMHLLQDRVQANLAHELAHVMAREFGMPVLRASPAVGLVEGLAVALEPPSGRPSVHDQVAAALTDRETRGVYGESLGAAVARQLSARGFWGGRGAVGYTTMGSFVRYLLDTHGPEPVREAYRTGRFEAAFGVPLETLAADWEAFLRERAVAPEALAVVAARFAVPSLFERRCPHHVPAATRHLRRGFAAIDAGDAEAAHAAFDRALRADSARVDVLASWARAALVTDRAAEATERLERAVAQVDTLAAPALLARLADAHRLAGRDAEADALYDAALAALPVSAHASRGALTLRRALRAEALAFALALDAPGARAERLRALGRGPALFHAAGLFVEAGQWAEAVSAYEAASGALPAIEAERLAGLSAALHRLGDHSRAAALAEAAARAYDQRGLEALAAQQRDRAALLRWNASR